MTPNELKQCDCVTKIGNNIVAYNGWLFQDGEQFYIQASETGSIKTLPAFLTKKAHVIEYCETLDSHYISALHEARRLIDRTITESTQR